MNLISDKISKILEALDHYDGKYKREEVNAALEVREEITPHLIGLLENILVDSQKKIARLRVRAIRRWQRLLGKRTGRNKGDAKKVI